MAHKNVISMRTRKALKPRNYTSSEDVLDRLRAEIFEDGRPYKVLAAQMKISPSTLQNIASGKTMWPRPKTLFPLIQVLGLEINFTRAGANE